MSRFHLAVALDGAGWHPAAWRTASARADALFDARYWTGLARLADGAGIDFVTFEDALTLQSADPRDPDERVDHVRGRLDAHLVATLVAPATRRIGLVPTITTTHTEPFHVANRIASLDHVSHGRAGWRVQVMRQAAEVLQFGRRDDVVAPPVAPAATLANSVPPLFAEAADAVEVARRLWDSWEDDAEIRDQATGRFIDRDKLHTVDFDGRFFSVRGPSITPRPPQGQPVVALLAHGTPAYELAATSADVVFTTPRDAEDASRIVAELRSARRVAGNPDPLLVFADVLVLLDRDAPAADQALDALDTLAGAPLRSDARIVASDAVGLADLLEQFADAGIQGFRLRPARLPADLQAITADLVPELHRRGALHALDASSLRGILGLPRPANRYAVTAGGTS